MNYQRCELDFIDALSSLIIAASPLQCSLAESIRSNNRIHKKHTARTVRIVCKRGQGFQSRSRTQGVKDKCYMA